MVDRNNAGRLVAGFISVCLETRWLGHFSGFYVPEPYCSKGRQASSGAHGKHRDFSPEAFVFHLFPNRPQPLILSLPRFRRVACREQPLQAIMGNLGSVRFVGCGKFGGVRKQWVERRTKKIKKKHIASLRKR